MAMIIVQLAAGLLLLIAGAEALVRGASRIAALLGITPLVIGLTVVAFGTSSPELAVGIMSGMSGQSALALGNVVGSNIFNVLFILGISALVIPLVVHQQIIRLDVPILIGMSLLTWLLAANGRISPWEGVLLAGLGAVYTFLVIQISKRETSTAIKAEYEEAFGGNDKAVSKRRVWFYFLLVAVGLGMLVLGSRWLVDSAVQIAQALGVSDLVIGLTIIAAGTSLPEVATSIIAGLRGERDIAVGNVVGSNLFNIFFILGIGAMVVPDGITVPGEATHFDIPVMTAVAVACLPVFFTGSLLDRWEGAVFLFYYVAYTVYLLLHGQQSEALEMYSKAMLWFVLPLTGLTLIGLAVKQLRANRKHDTKI